MATSLESSVLKVTLDSNGEVWVIAGDRMPVSTKYCVKEYVDRIDKAGAGLDKVRVLGSAKNAELIVRLYRLKIKNQLKSLEVGSPIISPNDDAAASLIKMRMTTLPPSMGGWHEASASDCVAYGVGVLMRSSGEGSHIQACDLMKQHPAWNYVSFIPHIDAMFFTKVMARIADPRWFIDIEHPNRLSRLNAWLGLCNGPQTDEKLIHKFDVYSCWSKGLTESSGELHKPGWFLLREGKKRWMYALPWVATLRMSQLFIKYVRMSWMDSLYPFPNPWMEPLLDPDLFFSDPVDATGFKNHMNKFM